MNNDTKYKSNYGKLYLEPIRRPPIRGTPEHVRKMLEPVDHLDLEPASDSGSDITDPFAELNQDNVYSKKELIRHLDRNEINQLIVDEFSEEYKRAMKVTRKDMRLDDNQILGENHEDLMKALRTRLPRQPMTEAKLGKRQKCLGEIYNLNLPVIKSAFDGTENDVNYMQSIWKATADRVAPEQFKITVKGYDVYEKYKPYWLEGPEYPVDKIEESKDKCSRWLLTHSPPEKKLNKKGVVELRVRPKTGI